MICQPPALEDVKTESFIVTIETKNDESLPISRATPHPGPAGDRRYRWRQYLLPLLSPAGNVVVGPRILDSPRPGHGLLYPRLEGNVKRLERNAVWPQAMGQSRRYRAVGVQKAKQTRLRLLETAGADQAPDVVVQ